MFIILNVDDLVFGWEYLVSIKKVKFLLTTKLEMKDLDKLCNFFGIEIIHKSCYILLSQYHILNQLFTFGIKDFKLIMSLLNHKYKMQAHFDSIIWDPHCNNNELKSWST